ncbi:MAG: hypothetical protein K1X94_13850 [Sandaracinaceae bacterium]|nr:hypothetical protein [Sandaracinaceae bacterium]
MPGFVAIGADRALAQAADVEVSELADAPAPPPVDDPLAAASRAYAELRLDDAWAEIQQVITRLDEAGGTNVPRETQVNAHVLAASIARARGELGASDHALDDALALDPTLTLDPALHPPPLIEALERRRTAYAALHPIGPIGREPVTGPTDTDPWPWVGLGAGVLVVVSGLVVLTVVLAQPDDDFDLRGTIVP